MTLKLLVNNYDSLNGFGTILNNMTLKQLVSACIRSMGFGTILNNMTLKPRRIIFFSMIPYSHHLSIARFQFRRSEFFLHVYYTKLSPSWRKNPPLFNGGFSLFSSCNSEPDFTVLSFCWSLILRKRNFWCCNDLVTR